MRTCLGGTFDLLHAGHHRLLAATLQTAARSEDDTQAAPLLLGLTSDTRAARGRDREVAPYDERAVALRDWFAAHDAAAEIVPLDDDWAPAAEGDDVTTIVVSEATAAVAARLNARREALGRAPLTMVTVPYRLAQDGLPVSATRVRSGEIDTAGSLLGTVRIGAGTRNPAKLRGIASVLGEIWPGLRLTPCDIATTVPPQPRNAETLRGAIARARGALEGGHALAVGIEAGLLWNDALKAWLDVQYCAIADRAGRVTMGHGGGFAYPSQVMAAVEAGATVGEAMGALSGEVNIGVRGGAIGYLTGGRLARDALTAQAVWMALVPRMRPELYH